MIDLDEAERIGKHAWDAPWFVDEDQREDGADQILSADDLTVCFMSTPIEHSVGNSAFIVYSRNNWQAMVDELRRLRDRTCYKWTVDGIPGAWYVHCENNHQYLSPKGPRNAAHYYKTPDEAREAIAFFKVSNERCSES